MTTFDLLPAIDLRGGRVVRLVQGDFLRETAFSDDPVAVARTFVDVGARWLHVVDLDGARTGTAAHGEVIAAIAAAVGDRGAVEVAGGLRSAEAVAMALDAGAERAVIGTAALTVPGFAGDLVARHGFERISVALDIRGGEAVGHGWVPGARGTPAVEAIERLSRAGVHWFEVTAIDRDGTMQGPDLEMLGTLRQAAPSARIVASGGIRSVEDLRAVREIGCAGAIVGRALYDGTLKLEAALEALGA
jgi:phosphoribosylformimino-5-aminoimidazole carboxamide ribotide isomerase